MSILQKTFPASILRISGVCSTDANGNCKKSYSYAGEIGTFGLKFGVPRIPGSSAGTTIRGISFQYQILTGSITTPTVTLQRYTSVNGAPEIITNIPLNVASPAYVTATSETITVPLSNVTTPDPDDEVAGQTIGYLFEVSMTCVTSSTQIAVFGCELFYNIASGSSDISGTLVTGQNSTQGYLNANGQVLTSASYPTISTQIGTTPLFTPIQKTYYFGLIDAAASDSVLVGIGSGSGAVIYRSPDAGATWNQIIGGGANYSTLTTICYCSSLDRFILAGTSSIGPIVSSSQTGQTWNPSPVPSKSTITLVAASPTLVVAAGGTDNAVYTSSDLLTWTSRSTASSGKTQAAITYIPAYGSGTAQFLLGYTDGTIETSPDGNTWTLRTSNIASQINQFALGQVGVAGTIVAVGNTGVISTSTDSGLTWTACTTQTSAQLSGVVWHISAGRFLASGTNIIMDSVDGIIWTTISGVRSTSSQTTIGWSGTQYFRVGSSGLLTTGATNTVYTGRVHPTPDVVFNSTAFGNSTYVAVGDSGNIISSADGITWTSRTSNAGANSLRHVIWVADAINLFVALGASGTIVTSPDGTTWTARTSNLTSVAAGALSYNGSTIVAVAASGKISSSTDGIIWTARTSNTSTNLNGVAWNGTIFCSVGNTGQVLTSPDGVTWTYVTPIGTPNTTNFSWITSDGTSFYVTNSTTTLYISANASTWTPYALPFTALSINYINSQLISVTANGDYYTSPNGQIWTQPANNRGVQTFKRSIYFGGNAILLNSNIGSTITSDGITFKSIFVGRITGITYSPSLSRYVIVGNTGLIAYGPDAISFTQVYNFCGSSSASFTDIAWSSTLSLYAATMSSGAIITSPDGITWTQQSFSSSALSSSAPASFTQIIWSSVSSVFVAIGTNGVIARSANGTTWTSQTNGLNINIISICSNTVLGIIALSTSSVIFTSNDAITWTSIPVIELGTSVLIQSMEAKGFMIYSTTGNLGYSSDGITFNPTNIINTFAISCNKSIWAPIDNCVMITTTSSSNRNSCVLYSNDAKTMGYIPYIASTSAATGIVYDSNLDQYAVANGGSVFRLTRSYNRSTQFVLPALNNILIKV